MLPGPPREFELMPSALNWALSADIWGQLEDDVSAIVMRGMSLEKDKACVGAVLEH